jgi:hypothetical protein
MPEEEHPASDDRSLPVVERTSHISSSTISIVCVCVVER